MKVAHLSDLHYCPKHLKWVDKAVGQAVEDAIAHQADVAVISGDSFDSSMGIHEPAVSAYLSRVITLAGHMPIIVLQGTFSHDRPGCLDPLKSMPTTHPVLVADEVGAYWLIKDGQWVRFGDEVDCPVGLFCCLPSINRARPDVVEVGHAAWIAERMREFAVMCSEAKETYNCPTFLISHGTVNGSLTESNYAMVSPDHEFHQDTLFASGADAIMLGHIHKHQIFANDTQIAAYPGSIARLVHGHHDQVGYLLWDVEPGSPMCQFIDIPSRQLLEIEFDGPPDMDELKELAATAGEDDAVRIRWDVDQEHADSVDKKAIKALFKHAESVKLDGIVNRIQSVRAAGISKAFTLSEKLGYFATTTGDIDSLPDMTHRLEMLQSMDVDVIVDEVVNQ